VRLRGPRNHFRLDESARALILIAGGIGITPIMAMARRARRLGIDYQLHYSASRRAALAFADELQALHHERLHLHPSDEGARLDLAQLLARPAEGTQVYACGPARMLHAAEAACAHWPAGSLRVEHFAGTARGALDPGRERAFEVQLADSGLRLTVPPDRSLLATLRAANVDVPSDCEEGLCGTCEVRVLAGEVEHRDVVLTRTERAAQDRIISCCSRAAGGRLVLAL
jgi:ferredoxin-NADP reductase